MYSEYGVELSIKFCTIAEDGAITARMIAESSYSNSHFEEVLRGEVEACAVMIREVYLDTGEDLLEAGSHEAICARTLPWFVESLREVLRYGYHPGVFFYGAYLIGISISRGEEVELGEMGIFVSACEIIAETIHSSVITEGGE